MPVRIIAHIMDEGFSLSRPYRVETRKRGGTLTVTLTLALSPRMRLHLEPANENKKLMEEALALYKSEGIELEWGKV